MDKVQEIIDLYSKIISTERVGSRFEGTDVTEIWALGNKIIEYYSSVSMDRLISVLEKRHHEQDIRFDYRLYRAAVVFREYWPNPADYLEVAKKLNAWTRLRELWPICKSILENEPKYCRDDVNKIVDRCEGLTYREVRDEFRRLREGKDQLLSQLGIDLFEFTDLVVDLRELLYYVIADEKDADIALVRKYLDKSQMSEIRLLLSALQTESVYQRHKKTIAKIRVIKNNKPNPLLGKIFELHNQLARILSSDAGRVQARHEIGASIVGTVATYLRAIESDDQLEQFHSKQKILDKFISQL